MHVERSLYTLTVNSTDKADSPARGIAVMHVDKILYQRQQTGGN